ncbi:MAG TPA: LppP/LprE family lipoprotein [Candidatus Dormibacteraeota bacterium]|nr:LppP/LprE family lipoprotein [Candidatus Dormibacteraeota bacterium]
MTELLLVTVLAMGGLLVAMVAARVMARNLAGLVIALAIGVLLIGVAGTAGVTALRRVASGVGGVDIQITNGVTGLQRSGPTASPRPSAAPTRIPGPPPALLAAERQVAAMGYQVADPGTFHPELALHVLVGAAGDGSAVPHHERAFFFDGDGALLGEDAPLPSASVLVVGQGPATAALAYQLYATDDPDCCPTLGKAAVRFRLDRGRVLHRIDPLPADAARRACCPSGSTPAAEPVPPGSRRQ